ncbi:MAG TPA: N-acetyl-gamma-glutamyl-phosphate reductase [Rickettsiales bacterium]|nr:N-acetyl-gamma-glutamyl-phosphate reductase [Rickettsiales bacterium]
MKQRVAIIGASGYTGAELLRFLLNHPHVEIAYLTADSQAGKPMREVYPHLDFAGLPDLIPLSQVDYAKVDIVFCCLPHGTTQQVIAAIPRSVKVIDLSADFRLENIETYAQWYGHAHQAPDLQKEAVYGLTEHARDAVKASRLIANPGCYPTSSLLPLMPLLKAGLIEADGIIIDAKSGVSGAGRAAKQAMLYTEVNEGMNAYGVASHRHAPEIEQGLSQACGKQVLVNFTPHLIPMNRGMLSTIYVTLAAGKSAADLDAALRKAYEGEAFVKVAAKGITPATHMVRGTNFCLMAVFQDRLPGRAIIVSVIDNLVKGASGQAIQNMNLMCGYPETLSIHHTAVFP